MNELFKNTPAERMPYVCKVRGFQCEIIDQITRTQEFLAILKTRVFRSRVGGQERFFWQLVWKESVCKEKAWGADSRRYTHACYEAWREKSVSLGGKERVSVSTAASLSCVGHRVPSHSQPFGPSSLSCQLLHSLFASLASVSRLSMSVREHVTFGGVKKVS